MENKLLKLKELDSFIEKIEGVYSSCSELCVNENNHYSVKSTIKFCSTLLKVVITVNYYGYVDIEIRNGSFEGSYFNSYIKQLSNIGRNKNNIIDKALDVIEA